MTVDEAAAIVRAYYCPCCDEAKIILDAAKTLVAELARLREVAEVLRDQRDAARAERV